jgi:GntR family transcriptional regulator
MSRSDANPVSVLSALTIDRKAEVPLGVQLAWALRARICDGTLGIGQRLPGARDVAETLAVNVNTVRSVYQRLERDGLIESRQGSGTFVSYVPPYCAAVASIVVNVVRESAEAGVDPREVAAALYASPRQAAGELTQERSDLARRRSLRSQIAGLERTLSELEAEHPGVGSALPSRRRSRGPALIGAGELEEVRRTLLRRLAALQVAIEEQAAAPGGSQATKRGAEKSAPSARKRIRPAPAAG